MSLLSAPPVPVLIIGAGNLLMGDEGVGVHVARHLESFVSDPRIRVLDGGTGGVVLLGELQSAERVIFIDATRDGQPAGTLAVHAPDRISQLPTELSAHEFGVKDLFAAALLLGHLPELRVLTISVEVLKSMCLELSPEVAAAVRPAAEMALNLASLELGNAQAADARDLAVHPASKVV